MSDSDPQQSKKPFTESGKCRDEVKLIFDDGNILYASESFLSYASPVFQAMFEHEFTEKESREVKLPGKKYEQFLEFLLTIHPALQKSVDNGNVFDVAAIAHEYQVSSIVTKCKTVIMNWLCSEYNHTQQSTDAELRKRVSACLTILRNSLQCKFEDTVEYAIKNVMCKFGYGVLTGKFKLQDSSVNNINSYRESQHITYVKYNYVSENEEAADAVCHKLFSELRDDIKVKILAERLVLCDKNVTL